MHLALKSATINTLPACNIVYVTDYSLLRTSKGSYISLIDVIVHVYFLEAAVLTLSAKKE